MYSDEWFETFAATVPAAIIDTELAGIGGVLPAAEYPRLLDVGCGIGRIAGPLAQRGYHVTGIDINLDALRVARRQAAGPRYVALDQRHVGSMRWRFDGALLLWNSLGFVGRESDLDTLHGLATVLRPGGRMVFDLYHPDWLAENQRDQEPDVRGAVVRRWMANGRCFNLIRYASGRTDDIQFDVYRPEEMAALASRAGFALADQMVWWRSEPITGAAPRYQLVCVRG